MLGRAPASKPQRSLACWQTVGRAKAKENRPWEGGGHTINVWKVGLEVIQSPLREWEGAGRIGRGQGWGSGCKFFLEAVLPLPFARSFLAPVPLPLAGRGFACQLILFGCTVSQGRRGASGHPTAGALPRSHRAQRDGGEAARTQGRGPRDTHGHADETERSARRLERSGSRLERSEAGWGADAAKRLPRADTRSGAKGERTRSGGRADAERRRGSGDGERSSAERRAPDHSIPTLLCNGRRTFQAPSGSGRGQAE